MNFHAPITAQAVTPADVARQAMWSLRHPLNQAMVRDRGATFSLRQLIEYAEELPDVVLADYARRGGCVIAEEIEG